MNIVSSRKQGCKPRISAVTAVILAAVLGGQGALARAQEMVRPMPLPTGPLPSASCPQPVRMPNIPVRGPRPAEGAAPDQQWRTDVDPAMPPTAAFLDTLRGNDAVIEVVVGQGRLLTLKADVANEQGTGVITVADPTVVDFDVMPNPRLIRLVARRAGVTDLSVTTAEGQIYNFEVRVVYDLQLLHAQMRQLFPDAQLRLTQIREHLAVEGEARSIRQVEQILKTLELYLASVQVPSSATGDGVRGGGSSGGRWRRAETPRSGCAGGADPRRPSTRGRGATTSRSERLASRPVLMKRPRNRAGNPSVQGTFVAPQIINLLRVPGVHQVMLQVQIAELNRTALRQIGADWEWDFGAGSFLQTVMGGTATVNGVFPSADLTMALQALRSNSLLSVLAEPNLVALSGQKAIFLAGGEFPVPVPQSSSSIGMGWQFNRSSRSSLRSSACSWISCLTCLRMRRFG